MGRCFMHALQDNCLRLGALLHIYGHDIDGQKGKQLLGGLQDVMSVATRDKTRSTRRHSQNCSVARAAESTAEWDIYVYSR